MVLGSAFLPIPIGAGALSGATSGLMVYDPWGFNEFSERFLQEMIDGMQLEQYSSGDCTDRGSGNGFGGFGGQGRGGGSSGFGGGRTNGNGGGFGR